MLNMIRSLVICLLVMMLQVSNIRGTRMIRLCIASVDLTKLSSQCVMCNRREFPLTAIDCTGITKMNDLISNPLSVKEASCLILNCRRVSWLKPCGVESWSLSEEVINSRSACKTQQVPNIEPEPYHGSVSHAARVNYASAASGTRSYGIMPPTPPRSSPYSTLYDNFSPSHIPNFADYSSPVQNEATLDLPSALS